MTNNYLKNLLDKSAQTQSIVEPRLKSRFEDSSGLSSDEGFVNTFEREDASIQKRNPSVSSSSEENKKDVQEKYQTNNFAKKNTNNSQENQTNFLNTTKNHFLSLEHKMEENRKESIEPMLSKSKGVEKESIEIHNHNSNNNIENNSYGMLNKPVKTSTIKENGFNGSYDDITKENIITTPVQPSIKISIGRVEVKAVKTSQKMPVKPKVKPNIKLSLEDYINKRK